jgi:hypothetical protein
MQGAWEQTPGSQSVVVGLVDTGIDRDHEDLKNNIWVNLNEINDNGIDDDGNGYIDDKWGWDFTNNSNNPVDQYGHGTEVAGTMGAVGNNAKGVVGVSWNMSIMDLRVYDAGGSAAWSNIVRAIQYAADMNVNIIHNSYQGNFVGRYAPLEDALQYAHDRGIVLIAPAGNYNHDALDNLPSSSQYTIAVAAMDQNNLRSIWGAQASNYGEKIDVTAPGTNILSSKSRYTPACGYSANLNPNYCVFSGTSLSSPHVTGLVALLLVKNPNLTPEEIRQILRITATDLGPAGKDSDFGYGRINGAAALTRASQKPLAPFIDSPKPYSSITGAIEILGTASGTNFLRYTVELGLGRSPSIWRLEINSSAPVTSNVLATIQTSNYTPGSYSIRLTAYDTLGNKYEYRMFDVAIVAQPTATPTITETPTPTVPSSTPTITLTPSPTPTPIPTPLLSCNPVATGINWSWNTIPGTSYWLQVSSEDGSEWLFNDWTSTTSYSTTGTAGQMYRARVLAGDGIQQSTFSEYTYCSVPVPTNTPTPTFTPVPTNTPLPTSTPVPPTQTPTPTPDKIGPTVVITTPLSGAVVPKNTNLNMAATVTDPSGVARVEFRLNGNRICNDLVAPYSCSWKVPNKVRQHTITVRGYDLKNNSAYVSIKIKAQ